MSAIDIAVEQIRPDEALRLHPYKDQLGNLTIGWGRNLTANGIRESEAQLMLQNDAQAVVEDLEKIEAYQGLHDIRKAVLINMAFNMGFHDLMNFHLTWAAIRDGDYREAARQMLDSRWARQVGRRARDLAKQMETGVLQ